jgi:hypothetical protein
MKCVQQLRSSVSMVPTCHHCCVSATASYLQDVAACQRSYYARKELAASAWAVAQASMLSIAPGGQQPREAGHLPPLIRIAHIRKHDSWLCMLGVADEVPPLDRVCVSRGIKLTAVDS